MLNSLLYGQRRLLQVTSLPQVHSIYLCWLSEALRADEFVVVYCAHQKDGLRFVSRCVLVPIPDILACVA